MHSGPFDVATCQYRCRHVRGRMGVCSLLSFGVELSLSQTEAISSTSSNTQDGRAAKSVTYSAKEDVVHECNTNNNISSEVTESSESNRGQGQGQGRYGKKRPCELDGEDILEGWTEE